MFNAWPGVCNRVHSFVRHVTVEVRDPRDEQANPKQMERQAIALMCKVLTTTAWSALEGIAIVNLWEVN